MIKVKAEEFLEIRKILKEAPTFVYSVLEQIIEGNIYTDSTNYHSILIQTKSGIYYVYGDPSYEPIVRKIGTLLQESREHNKRFTLFTYSDEWSAKINHELKGDVKRLQRYTFSFDRKVYNERGKCQSIDFECFKINQQHIDHSKEFTNQYYQEYWGTTSNFLKNGFGFCLQHKGKMISEAVSIFKSMQYAEIDIVTDPSYRGKGLANFIAETFIDYCLLNNLKPCWDCDIDNHASYYLANKLGFTNPRKYIVYTK